MNLNETVQQIKKAGAQRVRCIPMPGQNVNTGFYAVQIKEAHTLDWNTIVDGLPKSTAEDLIKQATSRLILG